MVAVLVFLLGHELESLTALCCAAYPAIFSFSILIMSEYKGWIEYGEDNDINIANAYKTLSRP